VSPATPFSVASLPNHTKMFELVHVVTSMEDFAYRGAQLVSQDRQYHFVM
jgi:hypothetical protein